MIHSHLELCYLKNLGKIMIIRYSSMSMFSLGIYVHASFEALSTITKEIAFDAISGTNNAGMLEPAVLADFDGIGASIAYLFVEKGTSIGSASPWATTHILGQFPRPLLELRFNPSFVACDRDKSEINTVQQVWPSAKVQL